MGVRQRDFARILRCASEAGISDVHLTANEPVCWRRGDVLSHLKEYVPSESDMYGLFKLIVREDAWEKMCSDNAVNCAWEMDSWRYRVHVYKKKGQISFAIRTLPRQIPALEQLGQAEIAGRFGDRRQGLFLVTGATGAGKSTTVAALLESMNRSGNLHILTLEDPIEFLFTKGYGLVSQLEKGDDFGDYFQAVENAMREGPDVIMVSELRDYRTVHAVLNAAVSGHYVIATMHAGSVTETVERLISMYPEEQQAMGRSLLAASLQGICAQRLLTGRGGIKHCAVECLNANHAARNIIRSGKYEQLHNIIQSGMAEGMQSMEMGVDKLRKANLLRCEFGKVLSAGCLSMAVYVYEGIDERGRRQKGCIAACDRIDAATKLRDRLLTVISLRRENWVKRLWRRRSGQGSDRFRLAFCRQMHIMLGAGLPVLEAVRIFAGDLDAAHKKSMERLLQYLVDGYSLSESMGLLEKEFSPTMIAMVQGGELSGNLPEVFGRMHQIFRKRQEIMQKLELAMAYPCLLCIIGAVLVIFLLCQVLPVFAEVFAGFGAELPGTTRLLLVLSDNLGVCAVLMIAVVLLFFLLGQAGSRFSWLGLKLGRLALLLPIWGRLKLRSEQANFLSVLAMMAHSGIRLHQGIGIARNMSGNAYWQFLCDSMSVQLEQGYSLGVCMEKSGLFPAMVLSMIRAGEQSGELAGMLEGAGEVCRGEAELLLERINVLAEPLIMLLLGGVAGFIVLSTVLPILDLMCVM